MIHAEKKLNKVKNGRRTSDEKKVSKLSVFGPDFQRQKSNTCPLWEDLCFIIIQKLLGINY